MVNRHRAREIVLKALYSLEINKMSVFEDIVSFETDYSSDTKIYAYEIYNGVITNVSFIDSVIDSYIINWDIERLSVVDLSILRLSIYSLIFKTDIPKIVVINEGVNLSKDYCSDKSYKLINGILDSIDIEVELSKSIKT